MRNRRGVIRHVEVIGEWGRRRIDLHAATATRVPQIKDDGGQSAELIMVRRTKAKWWRKNGNQIQDDECRNEILSQQAKNQKSGVLDFHFTCLSGLHFPSRYTLFPRNSPMTRRSAMVLQLVGIPRISSAALSQGVLGQPLVWIGRDFANGIVLRGSGIPYHPIMRYQLR